MEIKDDCRRLEQRLTVKGFVTPLVCAHVNWLGDDYCVQIEYRTMAGGRLESRFLKNSSMGVAFQDAVKLIDGLKTPEELRKEEVASDLGHLIDKAREAGMSVAFVNPLTEMMEKLSSNALEHSEIEEPASA